ncbi:MAG: pilus assembly PilX N-terminal domain-containing protein [Candidatus Eremiobacteraeota bacterium]|nr:pilus assembly PilX N-terminal domain-containing protein [Candidatus Eremiobacteraeota bacterium]
MRKIEKGIVLITTMLLLSFIVMIAALLMVTGRNTMILGATYSDREQAYYAAECGLAYMQYCISRDSDYRGETAYDPSFSHFTIEKVGTQNLIHGKLTDTGGEFYVAFCDGVSADIYTDGTSVNTPMTFYSFNNLMGDSESLSTKRHQDSAIYSFKKVPKKTAHIIVEGRCNQARRYVEAMLAMSGSPIGEACSITAGDIKVNLVDNDSVFLVNSEIYGNSAVRSCGNIEITSGGDPTNPLANDKNCFQIADKGTSYTGGAGAGTEATKVNGTTVTTANESQYDFTTNQSDQGSALKKAALTWDDVSKNYISSGAYDTSKVKAMIKSGTYVYKNTSAAPDTYNLYYVPVAFDPGSQADPDTYKTEWLDNNIGSAVAYNAGDCITGTDTGKVSIVSSTNSTNLTTSGQYLFTVKDPVGVDETNGNFGLSVLIYDYSTADNQYFPSSNYRTSVRLGDGSANTDPALVTLGGTGRNVYVDGELSGSGKVLCAGNLDFQGGSLMQTDPDRVANPDKISSVATYANGNVNINPVRGSGGSNSTNDVIQAAWDAYTSTLGTATNEYFNSGTDNYQALVKNLLETPISGTFTDSTGRSKTYSGVALKDVLTDTACFTFEESTASELVAMMLSKNSYLGTDSSSSGGGSGTTGSLTVGPGSSIGSLASSSTMDWVWDNTGNEAVSTITIDGKDYWYTAGEEAGKSWVVIVDKLDSNNWTAVSKRSGRAADVGTNGTVPTLSLSEGANFDFTATFTSGTDTVEIETKTNGQFEVTGGLSEIKTENSSTIQMLDKDSTDFKDLVFNDTLFKGLVYTHKNINAKDLQGGSLTIHGGLVAYGGDPATFDPTTSTTSDGKVSFDNGKNITFTYDPDYMSLFFASGAGMNTGRIFRAAFDGNIIKTW